MQEKIPTPEQKKLSIYELAQLIGFEFDCELGGKLDEPMQLINQSDETRLTYDYQAERFWVTEPGFFGSSEAMGSSNRHYAVYDFYGNCQHNYLKIKKLQ